MGSPPVRLEHRRREPAGRWSVGERRFLQRPRSAPGGRARAHGRRTIGAAARRRPPSSATGSGSANMAAARRRSGGRSRSTATPSRSSASRRPASSASRSVAASTSRCRCVREPLSCGMGSGWTAERSGSRGIGRLKPGWTVERAAAHLRAISPPIFKETLRRTTGRMRKKTIWTSGSAAVPARSGVSNLRGVRAAALAAAGDDRAWSC